MTRGVYRGVYSSLFDDPDFQSLSSDGRLTFLTARQCLQAGPAAIFRYYPGVLAAQTGLSESRVLAALDELRSADWCAHDGVILWIKNGLRHDPMLRISDPKHLKAVMRAIDALPHREIVLTFCDYYAIARPFQGSSEDHPRPIPNTDGSNRPSRIPSRIRRVSAHASETEAQFIIRLKENPAYQAINIDRELAKMDAWLSTPAGRGRKKTRRFIVNWLNRIDVPVGQGPKTAPFGLDLTSNPTLSERNGREQRVIPPSPSQETPKGRSVARGAS